MIKVHDVFVVQRSVQLDFPVNLAGNNNKQRKNKQKSHQTATLNGSGCARRGRGESCALFYLLALVRLGDARVRDDLGRVNFAGGEVGHLVALCETSLCWDGETNKRG